MLQDTPNFLLMTEPDLINSPPHYTHGPIEVIDLIELFDLDFREGNALKYLLRWRRKGGVEDLRKAIWYIERTIKAAEDGPGSTAPRGLKEELRWTCGLSGENLSPTSYLESWASTIPSENLERVREVVEREIAHRSGR